MDFRSLRANEVECRIGAAKENGVSLLLYKDARCDMNILDETLGAFDWQRDHKELKGNIYCGVGVYWKDRDEWVWKWDAGAESNTEAVKGESSDSFKRACFCWGIGRELYTAPFIWIKNAETKEVNGKWKCYERFTVSHMEVKNHKITALVIKNDKGQVVYSMGKIEENWLSLDQRDRSIENLKTLCDKAGKKFSDLLDYLGLSDEKEITMAQYAEWVKKLSKEA